MYFTNLSADKYPSLQKSYDVCSPMEDPTVMLKNKELWKKFHELDTEMIITKNGRRMFPSLQVQISNLDPLAVYCIVIELNPVNHCRYKFSSAGGWSPAGTEEAQSPQRVYLHPDSPASGEFWMSQHISFGRLKLTNTPAPPIGHLVLSSMHKYQPRIIIAKTTDPRTVPWSPSFSVSFPETQFIAVTAYQNDKITKLKIDNNPFAKGFRENGQCTKRKRQEVDDRVIEIERENKQAKLDEEISPLRIEDTEDRLSPSTLSSGTLSPKKDDGIPDSPTSSYVRSCPQPSVAYPYSFPYHQSSYLYPYYQPSYLYPPSLLSVYSPYYPNYSIPIANNVLVDLSQNNRTEKEFTDFSIRALIGCL